MTRVFERLYLGDARDAERLAVSNPLSISAVVNVNSWRNRPKRDGIEYVHLAFDESERAPPARFEHALTAISRLIRRGRVLVHCQCGSSRSPVVVALYMHSVGYKNFDDALSELVELRPIVAPSKWMVESAIAHRRSIRLGRNVPRGSSLVTRRVEHDDTPLLIDPEGDCWNDYPPVRVLYADGQGRVWRFPRRWLPYASTHRRAQRRFHRNRLARGHFHRDAQRADRMGPLSTSLSMSATRPRPAQYSARAQAPVCAAPNVASRFCGCVRLVRSRLQAIQPRNPRSAPEKLHRISKSASIVSLNATRCYRSGPTRSQV
jgi:protein-tyrosine phosphatase